MESAAAAGRAIGVFGGAFNPPHLGHLILAREAIATLGLERLIVVPTGEAPHKVIDPEPGPGVRLELAAAAFADESDVEVSDAEVGREGPSWTFRTLEVLADELPGSSLTLVMGADAAAGLPSWKRPDRVLELAGLAIAGRPSVGREAVDAALAELAPRSAPRELEMPEIGISSSMVRKRVAAGRPVRWLVPPRVADLIEERNLYREEVAA